MFNNIFSCFSCLVLIIIQKHTQFTGRSNNFTPTKLQSFTFNLICFNSLRCQFKYYIVSVRFVAVRNLPFVHVRIAITSRIGVNEERRRNDCNTKHQSRPFVDDVVVLFIGHIAWWPPMTPSTQTILQSDLRPSSCRIVRALILHQVHLPKC